MRLCVNPVHRKPAASIVKEDLGSSLWGGLLFYDEHNLMHSGMYLEHDIYVRPHSLNRIDAPGAWRSAG